MTTGNYATQQFLIDDTEQQQWDSARGSLTSARRNHSRHKDVYEDLVTNSEVEDSSPPPASSSNDSPDKSKLKRKEQNRAAQRAFRERKERYVKELEEKIKDIQQSHAIENDRLLKENEHLQGIIKQMESEIYTLKGAVMAFELSINKLREAGIEVPGFATYGSGGLGEPSPPASDLHSMTSGASECPGISYSPSVSTSEHHHHTQQRRPSTSEKAMDETEDFAESEQERFKHTPDPITKTGARMIPQNEVWDWFSRHPRFEDLELETVCKEVADKAVCSGSGAVIPEYVLEEIAKVQLANSMEL